MDIEERQRTYSCKHVFDLLRIREHISDGDLALEAVEKESKSAEMDLCSIEKTQCAAVEAIENVALPSQKAFLFPFFLSPESRRARGLDPCGQSRQLLMSICELEIEKRHEQEGTEARKLALNYHWLALRRHAVARLNRRRLLNSHRSRALATTSKAPLTRPSPAARRREDAAWRSMVCLVCSLRVEKKNKTLFLFFLFF